MLYIYIYPFSLSLSFLSFLSSSFQVNVPAIVEASVVSYPHEKFGEGMHAFHALRFSVASFLLFLFYVQHFSYKHVDMYALDFSIFYGYMNTGKSTCHQKE